MPNVINFHLPKSEKSPPEVKNDGLQKEDRDLLYSLSLTQDSSPIEEKRLVNNRVTLSAGFFSGVTTRKTNTVVKAATGASLVDGQITVSADAVFDGVEFTSSSKNPGTLVVVKTGTVAVFRNCIFSKDIDTITNGTAISVAAGAKAIVTGCVFRGGNGSDVPIANSAAAADVQIIGTYNKTGVAFGGGVTTTAVIE
tara:strand:- start:9355 stop:9945 length:591 start_codon:yes stop_codon:yes gene_type:complete